MSVYSLSNRGLAGAPKAHCLEESLTICGAVYNGGFGVHQSELSDDQLANLLKEVCDPPGAVAEAHLNQDLQPIALLWGPILFLRSSLSCYFFFVCSILII